MRTSHNSTKKEQVKKRGWCRTSHHPIKKSNLTPPKTTAHKLLPHVCPRQHFQHQLSMYWNQFHCEGKNTEILKSGKTTEVLKTGIFKLSVLWLSLPSLTWPTQTIHITNAWDAFWDIQNVYKVLKAGKGVNKPAPLLAKLPVLGRLTLTNLASLEIFVVQWLL